MRTKTSRPDETHSFLATLFERGEEVVSLLLEDLVHNPGMRQQLGKSVGRAAKAKRSVDRNIQSLLAVLNLPSRADYDRLAAKVEALQGSLLNVNMKLDRLLAERQGATPSAEGARPRTAGRGRRPRPQRRTARGS